MKNNQLPTYEYLKESGFDDTEIENYLRPKLAASGFADMEINQYFQNKSGKRALSLAGNEQSESVKKLASEPSLYNEGKEIGFLDALKLGYQDSVTGMIIRNRLPDALTEEQQKSFNPVEKLVSGAASVAADIPVYAVGGKVGAAVGGTIGAGVGAPAAGVGAVPGAAIGAAIGGGAGAFGIHAAMRALLVDNYQRGEVSTMEELLYRVVHAGGEGSKGAVVGAVTAGAGVAVKGATAAMKVGSTASAATQFVGEGVALTGASAGVEGRLPTDDELVDNLALLGILKGAHAGAGKASEIAQNKVLPALKDTYRLENYFPAANDFMQSAQGILSFDRAAKLDLPKANRLTNRVQDKLMKIYAQTGQRPEEVMKLAQEDPVFRQKLLEVEEIKKAFEEVKKDPVAGDPWDVMAEIKPDELKSYFLQRGAAIRDKEGNVVVQGRALKREKGTAQNFGLVKMIFKHGITAEEAALLPSILREYEPLLGKGTKKEWVISVDEKHNLVLSTSVMDSGKEMITTMYRAGKAETPDLSKKKTVRPSSREFSREEDTNQAISRFVPDGEQSNGKTLPPDRLYSESKDTNQAISVFIPDGSSPKDSIGKNGENVNPEVLENRTYQAATKISIPGDKNAFSKEGLAEEYLHRKSDVVDLFKKALDIPIRVGSIRRSQRVLGIYKVGPEVIRTRVANDVSVISHEVGHHLEKKVFGSVNSAEVARFSGELAGIATKGSPSAEGFAEFIAKYVVDPAGARAAAPNFYPFFEKTAQQRAPEIYEMLQQARIKTRAWAEQPYINEVASSIASGKESIRETELTLKQRGEKWIDGFKRAWIDDLHPLKKITDKVTNGKLERTAPDNPYFRARMFRGWVGKAEHFLKKAPFDFNTFENKGKSLAEVLGGVEDLTEFNAYLVAKRIVTDLEPRNIESGVRPTAAKKTVEALEPKYAEMANDLYAYQESLLRYAVDGGLLTERVYSQIKNINKARVPFYRVLEPATGYALGSRNMSAKNPVKHIKGSGRDIIDPIEGIIKDTFAIINAVEKNRVGLAVADLAKVEGAGKYVEKVPTPLTRTIIPKEAFNKAGEKLFPQDAELFSFALKEIMGEEIYTAGNYLDKNNQIRVLRKGKAEIYQVDPEIAKIINGLNPVQINDLMRAMGFFAKTLRAGATGLNVAFGAKNLIRDTTFAVISSESGYHPLYALKGGKMSITKGEMYWEWQKAGGGQATFVAMDRNALQKNIRDLTVTGWNNKLHNLIENPSQIPDAALEPLRFISETSEQVTRIGEFMSSMKGKPVTREALEQAGFNSREITLDFAKGGSASKAVNAIKAFFNANVLGLHKTVEIMRDPVKAGKALAILGTIGALTAIHQYEDEDIDEVNQAQKDTNWVFKLPFNVKNEKAMIRIPKPQQIGFISTFFEQVTKSALIRMDGKERNDFFEKVSGAFFNEVQFDVVPTAVTPIMENYFNKSIFWDRAIVPAEAEGALPEYQYTDYTTELAKAANRLIGGVTGRDSFVANALSPAKLENIVRGWTGGVGNYLMGASDAGLQKAGLLPSPVKPSDTLADISFVRAFFIRTPSGSAESIQRFYDEYAARSKYVKSFKLQVKRLEFNDLNELAEYQSYSALNGVHQAMGEQSKLIRDAYRSPEMNADEKRQFIDNMLRLKIATARQGLEQIKQIDSFVKEKK